MSYWNENLSDYGINIKFLCGDVTPVDHSLPNSERCLPFTVLTYQEPAPGTAWHGCGCICPEGEYFSAEPACWIIPPYCRHQFRRLDRLHISTWGHFEFTIGCELDLMHFYEVPRFVSGEKALMLKELLKKCHRPAEYSPAAVCAGKGAQYQLLAEVLECSKLLQGSPEEVFNPFFNGIFQYIRKNLNRPVSLDEVAAFAGLSRSSLEKKFRAAIGVSPGEFILRSRLREAAWMLRSTAMTAKEIAEATGFADVYTFSKAFQRKFHRPPICFRKEKIFS